MRDPISAARAADLPGLLRERVARTPDTVAYRECQAGVWRALRWREIAERVARWRGALRAAGLERGDRVLVMLPNSVDWVCADLAALGLGLVTVPAFHNDRPGNVAYLLGDSGARLALLPDAGVWRAVHDAGSAPALETVVLREGAAPEPCVALEDWLAGAEPVPATANDAATLASIVYTSGTTGRPKGVMLTHGNILSNVVAAESVLPVECEDRLLSFLPLSHMLERTAGYYAPMLAGAEVVFARSVDTLTEDLREHRPTLLVTVPRLFERAAGAVLAGAAERGRLAALLLRCTVALGWAAFEHAQGRRRRPLAAPLLPLLRRRVAGAVLERLGGRLRLAICGGAPLQHEAARLFIGLGLPIAQGYGLTETSPVICVNPVDDNRPDTVGPPLPGVEVRLGTDGELLARGPNLMPGYWNNAEATAAAIDVDGWLHTGDQAEFVGEHVRIIGRLKDIIVLANGEKVPPNDIEAALLDQPLFQQVLLIGEGRPHLALLAVVEPQAWTALAAELGLDAQDGAALDAAPAREAALRRANQALRDFPGYAKVRHVALLREPWTVENELLTPTQKTRRPRIEAAFAERIEALYGGR